MKRTILLDMDGVCCDFMTPIKPCKIKLTIRNTISNIPTSEHPIPPLFAHLIPSLARTSKSQRMIITKKVIAAFCFFRLSAQANPPKIEANGNTII